MALVFSDLLGLAQQAGFSGDAANTAAAIAMAESGGNPNAIAYEPNGTTSYGLTQINSSHPGASSAYGDPAAAFSQMFSLSNGGSDFTPWTTYNNGAYSNFLPAGSGGSSSDPSNPAGGISTIGSSSFWGNLLAPFSNMTGGMGGTTENITSGSNDPNATSNATDALGNAVGSSLSPLSQIFAAIGDLFQRGGLILLGVIVLAIGVYFVAKPKIDGVAAKVLQ